MQFVLLIYQGTTPLPGTPAWDELSQAEQKQIYADYGALNKTPGVEPGLPLGLPQDATTVRVQDGKVVSTDGPLLGNDGAVAGFSVFEADDREAAVELASKIPAARLGGAVEIRPVGTYW
jgi:hypothetical protein